MQGGLNRGVIPEIRNDPRPGHIVISIKWKDSQPSTVNYFPCYPLSSALPV
jgi:hypothetical protein